MSKSNPSEKELREKLKQVGDDILKISANKSLPLDDLLFRAEMPLLKLYSDIHRTCFGHIEPHLKQLFEEIFDPLSERCKSSEMKTGLSDLDNVLKGLHPGNLYIIGGSPGMGKTALALTILRNVAVDENVPAGIFSLDFTSIQIAMRLLCMEAKVDSHILRTGNLPKSEWSNIESSVAALSESNIFIDDMTSLSPMKMKHKAIRLKAEHDIKLLIVDYLQLIQGIGKNDKQKKEARVICRLFKTMAVEFDIPVIITSQLTRQPEDWEDRRPVLYELQYASEIEESADTIMLLYRPWVYTLDEDDRELAVVIIAKNRNGPTGIVNMQFIDKYALFE